MTPIIDKKALCVDGFAVFLVTAVILFLMAFQAHNAPIALAIIVFSGFLILTGFTMISPN